MPGRWILIINCTRRSLCGWCCGQGFDSPHLHHENWIVAPDENQGINCKRLIFLPLYLIRRMFKCFRTKYYNFVNSLLFLISKIINTCIFNFSFRILSWITLTLWTGSVLLTRMVLFCSILINFSILLHFSFYILQKLVYIHLYPFASN